MSLRDYEEIKRLDPHIDPLDVCRLMFVETIRGLRKPAKPPKIEDIGKIIEEGPLVGAFLVITAPIGGVAEGAARAYKLIRERRGRT